MQTGLMTRAAAGALVVAAMLGGAGSAVASAKAIAADDAAIIDAERIVTNDEEVVLTWYDIDDPLLIHTQPGEGGRRYGVCSLLIPSLGARLTVDGSEAAGRPWPMQREGRPFSTCALAFSESWTESR